MGARMGKLKTRLRTRRKRRKGKEAGGLDNQSFVEDALKNMSKALAFTLARCVQSPSGISRDALLAVQTWANLGSNQAVLASLDSFAILDLEGEVLASTPDWKVTKRQAQGIIHAAGSTYHQTMHLSVGSLVYTCFHSDQSLTMIGRDNDHVIVVHRGTGCCVIGLKNLNGSGSCLHFVSELVHFADRHREPEPVISTDM